MCQDGNCDHNHEPEERSIESDFKLHSIIAMQAQAKGNRRQHQRHALIAMALGQRIHMRNSVENRLKAKVEGEAYQKLVDTARIAHSHGAYIRKAS